MGCAKSKSLEPAETEQHRSDLSQARAVKATEVRVEVDAAAEAAPEPPPRAAATKSTEVTEVTERQKTEMTEAAPQASAVAAQAHDPAESEAEPLDDSPPAGEPPQALPEEPHAHHLQTVTVTVAEEPSQPAVEPEREAEPAALGSERQAANGTTTPPPSADWLGSASLGPSPAAEPSPPPAVEEEDADLPQPPVAMPVANESNDGMTPWRRQQSHQALWKPNQEQQPAAEQQQAPTPNHDEYAADLAAVAAELDAVAAEAPGAESEAKEDETVGEESAGAVYACVYELFWIHGLTQRWGGREHRVLLTRSDADSAFASVAPHSRVCVVTRRDGDGGGGGLVTSCYRAWLPPARWHEAALSEWVRKEHPTLRDDIFVPAAAASPGRAVAERTSQQQLGAEAETPSTPLEDASSRSAAAPPPINSGLLRSMSNVFSTGPEGAWTRAVSFK